MMGCIFILPLTILVALLLPVLMGSRIRTEISCSSQRIVGILWAEFGILPIKITFSIYKGLNGYHLHLFSPVYEIDQSVNSIKRPKKRKRKGTWLKAITIEGIEAEIGFENAAALALVCGSMAGLIDSILELLQSNAPVKITPLFGAKGFTLKLAGMVRVSPLQIIGSKRKHKRRKRQCPIP